MILKGKTLAEFPDVLELLDLEANNITFDEAKAIKASSSDIKHWFHYTDDDDKHIWNALFVNIVYVNPKGHGKQNGKNRIKV